MRHAQRYWLTIQARAAIEKAMNEEADFAYDSMDSRVWEWHDEGHHYPVLPRLIKEREHCLLCAAENLAEAERYHREIVRLGGSVE